MNSRQSNQRGAAKFVVCVCLTLVVLLAATALLSAVLVDRFSRWRFLVELVGVATLLVGVIGLSRRVSTSPHASASSIAGDIAVILAGGILLGTGWAAAVGLGVIAAAGLIAERRNSAEENDQSA